MSKITDYRFLFQKNFGTSNTKSSISLSSLSSNSVQAQLKSAGINTSSNQYKAVIRDMLKSAGNREAYTTIQAIKNQLSQYDKDGDYIDPTTGLAGLLVTDENRASKNKIISIPESSRQEMFELTKKEFLRENGISNGDTTKRSDVYTNLYRKMNKNDRLAAGHTLSQYERHYRQAFVSAVKEADSSWEIGKPIKSGVLDNITRESVETNLTKSECNFAKTTVDLKI